MKVFPVYEARPIVQTHKHRKNVLDLSTLEKKGLEMFLETHGVNPKSWLLDGWLSCKTRRVSPLVPALFISEWAQERRGHHPLAVLVALAKLREGDSKPDWRELPPSKDALRQILAGCRGLSLDDDGDFETLIETLVEGISSRELF